MKIYISVLALLALPACLGGGSDSSTDLTPDGPSVSLNNDFGVLMNGVRLTENPSASALTYDARLGQAAQIHANDMFTRDYTSIFVQGSDNGMGGEQDLGDLVNDQGYAWQDIGQLVEEGDHTLATVLDEWSDDDCLAVNAKCIEESLFEDFGFAKAGSGSDQRWVLILTDPQD